MQAVVYDTGALIAAERANIRFFGIHQALTKRNVQPVVPVVVLAQAWRGRSHPGLSRMLKGCLVLPDDERAGRTAGALCAASGTSDVVDALVVVTALTLQATLVTSDPEDMRHLLKAWNAHLEIVPV